MVESSDLQGAIQRTQATARVAALQNEQQELDRKRFELEIARQRAEQTKKARDVREARGKRVVRDTWDGHERKRDEERPPDGEAETPPEDGPTGGGGVDVRV